MRYILNDNGFIETISFNYMVECNNKLCTEYTGTTPTGYETLAEWSETANINAYKIVEGNLVFDSEEDARLQSLWASQQANSGTGGGGGVTGDTLPIGSEVDYNGDTVPTGWEKVDNPDDYSTNETFTGKHWKDGKKVYRKVIDIGALPNTGGRYYPHNISNLSRIVEFSAFAYTSDGITIPIPYATPYQLASNISIDIEPTRFYIYTGVDRSNLTGYATIEYTKTTD